jgi:hypothetical protein
MPSCLSTTQELELAAAGVPRRRVATGLICTIHPANRDVLHHTDTAAVLENLPKIAPRTSRIDWTS